MSAREGQIVGRPPRPPLLPLAPLPARGVACASQKKPVRLDIAVTVLSQPALELAIYVIWTDARNLGYRSSFHAYRRFLLVNARVT
jgi:hypothetical protein